MKVKVLATGDIISVRKDWSDFGGVPYVGYIDKDEKFYRRDEVEVLPQAKEETMKGWIARDEDGGITLYEKKPTLFPSSGSWYARKTAYMDLDPEFFLDLKWGDEPLRVKITITPIE